MNIDHFTFIDASDVLPSSPSRRPRSLEVSPIFSTTSGPDDLRGQYKSLPKAKKTNWSDFAVVHVNPSVIPTYLPTVRLWSYNVSREEDGGWRQKVEDGDRRINGSQLHSSEAVGEWATYDEEDDDEDDSNDDQCELDSSPSPPPSLLRFLSLPSFLPSLFPSLPHTLKKKKHHHHHRRPTPHRPRYYSPLSPSCTNQFLTPLGYTQFFIDLDTYNENSGYGAGEVGKRLLEEGGEKGVRPGLGYEVEYTTFEASALAQGLEEGRGAVPRSLLPGSVLEVLDSEEDGPTKRGKLEAAIEGEGWVSYGMKDLTIGSWLEMGRKLGRSKKAWKLFEERMYVGMGP
jgi:endopolyphosphatase